MYSLVKIFNNTFRPLWSMIWFTFTFKILAQTLHIWWNYMIKTNKEEFNFDLILEIVEGSTESNG